LLGTYQNHIHSERQDAAPRPIKVLSNNGNLIQVTGNDIVRIGSNGDQRIVVSNDIVMNQHYITNLIDPSPPHDAETKQYVDRKARKCRVGLVPDLTANFDTATKQLRQVNLMQTTVHIMLFGLVITIGRLLGLKMTFGLR